MDAFYASVEQLDRPEHRGKPVIVGADPMEGRGRGVVAACSYEARAFGVRSALPISKAWRLCPHGIYLRPRFERYAQVSEHLLSIFSRFTDTVEPLSIDEAFLDVTHSSLLFGPPGAVARAIKEAVRAETGLIASVGVAPNKFLAKVASDLGKPDGLVEVSPAGVKPFLASLPVARLWGVGPKTTSRLQSFGLKTIGQVAALTREELGAILGTQKNDLWKLANGIDSRPVIPEWDPKSIGAEVTFSEDTDDPNRVRETLLRLSDRVGERLRRNGLTARGVTLKLRDEGFTTATRSITLPASAELGDEIYRAASELLSRLGWVGKKIRLVGVAATRLEPAKRTGQLDLFSPAEPRRKNRLARAVDDIRGRFGDRAISRASALDQKEK